MGILEKAKSHLKNNYKLMREYTEKGEAGKVRHLAGLNLEELVTIIWQDISKEFPLLRSCIRTGADTPVVVKSKNGRFTMKESVDKHCYINDKLVLAVECKTYLDKCFLQRAVSDFGLIKKHKNVPRTIILAGENSISDNSFNFFMEEGGIDRVLYIATGKRSSIKDKRIYYNEHKVSDKLIIEFIDYIREVFKSENN